MELFAGIRCLFKLAGLLPINSPNGHLISAFMQVFVVIMAIGSQMATGWYFLFEANHKTFVDKTNSFTSLIMEFYMLEVYLILLWQLKPFLDMFESIQRKINKFESYPMAYVEAYEYYEILITKKIMMPWLKTLTPLIVLPVMFQSYYLCYVTDTGPSSFKLPFPAT